MEVSVLSRSLTSLWPASFGPFACLDFGPCSLFTFLSLSWVRSFYKFDRVFQLLKVYEHKFGERGGGKIEHNQVSGL